MSESSLPFFASLRSWVPRRLLPVRLNTPFSRQSDRTTPREEAAVPEALETEAAGAVREYLRSQATLLERAERLGERAERLEKAGIPSESARNRAERAREEIMIGLSALRDRFVAAAGSNEGARRAFGRAVDLLCPTFKPLY